MRSTAGEQSQQLCAVARFAGGICAYRGPAGTCGWMQFCEGGPGIPVSESLEEGGEGAQESTSRGCA